MYIFILYIACGALSGFFSGLLGIGGGLVVVPLLTAIFEYSMGSSVEHIMHMVVATSLTASIFTAMASARAHTKKNAVKWHIVKQMFIYIILGTLSGTFVASYFSSASLRVIIVLFLFFVATQILFDLYPKPKEEAPKNIFYRIMGMIIGFISSLVGLAGGSLFVPFLRYTGLDMHMAVGTSSALAWAIAGAGALGYAVSGFGVDNLPAWNVGYINIPAMLGIAIASIFFVPLGVRISHALPVDILKRIFAIFLYLTATRMLVTLF